MKKIADHIELALDAALHMTFPASDPIAVSSAGIPKPGARAPIVTQQSGSDARRQRVKQRDERTREDK